MIYKLRGVIREHTDTSLVLDVSGVSYQVFVPPSILAQLADAAANHDEIELITYHYQQLEPSRGIPVLIGFMNDIEREFFERFITVSGVGPKAALRALAKPIPLIAKAIDEGNMSFLKSLPGIGEQRAKEIVAKLQGKVGKFALIQTGSEAPAPAADSADALEEFALDLVHEADEHRDAAAGFELLVVIGDEFELVVVRGRVHELREDGRRHEDLVRDAAHVEDEADVGVFADHAAQFVDHWTRAPARARLMCACAMASASASVASEDQDVSRTPSQPSTARATCVFEAWPAPVSDFFTRVGR